MSNPFDFDATKPTELGRIVVALVKDAGGIVRLSKDHFTKPNTGDRVIIEDYGGGDLILRLDNDDMLEKEVKEAAAQVREMIYDLEVKRD